MSVLDLFSLEGEVALVTGGTHGLGMAVATALAEAGATLVINGHSAARLEKALQTYKDKGIDARGYLFDVTDEAQVVETVARIEQEVGPIGILVNNAGIIKRIPALEMTLGEWNDVITTDLTAPFLMSRTVAAGMIRRGRGKIINMCSMMSEVGRNSVTAYAAAKGGLKMLTKNLATEWASHNIQVNGMRSGVFRHRTDGPHPCERPSVQRFHRRPDACHALGRSGGSGRNGRFPGIPCFRFRERSYSVCGRRHSGLAGPGLQ